MTVFLNQRGVLKRNILRDVDLSTAFQPYPLHAHFLDILKLTKSTIIFQDVLHCLILGTSSCSNSMSVRLALLLPPLQIHFICILLCAFLHTPLQLSP